MQSHEVNYTKLTFLAWFVLQICWALHRQCSQRLYDNSWWPREEAHCGQYRKGTRTGGQELPTDSLAQVPSAQPICIPAKYWFLGSEWDWEPPRGIWRGGRGLVPAWIRTAQTWLTSGMNVWLRLGKEPMGRCSKRETWRTEVALLRWSGYGCRPVRRGCHCPLSERWQFWGTWRRSNTPTWSGEEVGPPSWSLRCWV